MTDIQVQKVADAEERTLPVFKEIDEIVERIRKRAFEMFSRRGSGDGHALDDWLAAEREICWPAGELVEQDKRYILNLALPGFKAGDIAVTATAHDLIVHATSKSERKKEAGEKDEKVCWSEFRSNDVYRQVDLPQDIDPQSVSASLDSGLLKVVANKTDKSERTTPVTAAA